MIVLVESKIDGFPDEICPEWKRDKQKLQDSHSDWKTWENGKAFSSQGKVREF